MYFSLDYGEITKCMKQDTNFGWTSYDFKSAPMPSEDACKAACSANPECDFYVFIDSITLKCWCGSYKKPENPMNLEPLKSVTEVTLKFKKGRLNLFCMETFEFQCYLFQMKIL